MSDPCICFNTSLVCSFTTWQIQPGTLTYPHLTFYKEAKPKGQRTVYHDDILGFYNTNKPKEYPQQRETKTVAKHAMNEVCLLPRPFYSRGRACKLQSRHKHCMKKTFFQKRLRYCGQHARSSCKGFSSQRTAVRLTLHFIYLTYIIHIFFVLYITYIFYTIF